MSLDDLMAKLRLTDPALAADLVAEIESVVSSRSKARYLSAIGVLAGGIGHNFNNLLTAVLGNAELLRDSKLCTEDMEFVNDIRVSGSRAADLVRTLMSYAQKNPMNKSDVDMHQLIKEKVGSIGSPQGVSISMYLNAGRYAVLGDRSALGCAIESLLNNAVESISDSGVVEVSTACHRLDQPSLDGLLPGDYLAVKFKDSGCGMSDEVKGRLFEPFFTTKGMATHRGMGLASAYGRVRSHYGAIDVDTTPGKGSVFALYLPLVKDSIGISQTSGERVPECINSDSSKKILVLEHDLDVRNLLCRVVRGRGYDAIPASDVSDLMAKFERNYMFDGAPIALVMLDVAAPGLDFPQVMDRIIRTDRNVRFVLGMSFIDDFLPDPSYVVGRLEKPYQVSLLNDIIDRL